LTTQVLAGLLLLLILPVAYNLLHTLLARSFDYPDILRQPTGQVLDRFAAGGSRLVLTWWGFALHWLVNLAAGPRHRPAHHRLTRGRALGNRWSSAGISGHGR